MLRSTSPGAVVGGDPASERDQFGIEHGLGVEQAHRGFGGHLGMVVMTAQDDPDEFARPERHHDAAAGLDAMPQRIGKRVRERLIERYGQTDIAELEGTVGHGWNFQLSTRSQ
jgi:hypothetical protein